MSNKVICGEYIHFKGNPYVIYGTAIDTNRDEFVLYQHDYGTKEFWIRPVPMFYEIIERDGKTMARFKLIKEVSARDAFDKLIDEIASSDFKINHSETLDVYVVTRVEKVSHQIFIDKNI